MPTDSTIAFGLDLARFDAHTRARVLALLRNMEKELIAKLPASTVWGANRIKLQTSEARTIISRYFTGIASQMEVTAAEVANVAALSATANVTEMASGIVVTLSKSDARIGYKLVNVDTAKFDAAFSKNKEFYVGMGGVGGIGKRYENVRKYISDTGAIEASSVGVNPDGSVMFDNGRHRYAAIRDAGAKEIVVAMEPESIANATAAGYLVPMKEPVLTIPGTLPTENVMRQVVSDSMILGAPQREWWMRQSDDAIFRFTTAIQKGVVAAETNQQIIRRVRDELAISQRNAAALVQTSIQTVANNARLATFEQNSDLVSGLRWISTLDSKTCTSCGPRDGMTWNTDHSRRSASYGFVNPPLHYNCRCTLVPLTRFSDFAGKRASIDGPVDSKTTFTDFLDRKGTAFQDEVLGKGRAGLYRAGKITLTDLVSGNGRPLTIDQLKARYA